MAKLLGPGQEVYVRYCFAVIFFGFLGRAGGQGCLRLFLRATLLSGLLAILHVSASLYMLAIYDQVLPSGSVTALAALIGLATALHALTAMLDARRARLVLQAGLAHVELLDRHVLAALKQQRSEPAVALLDHLERVRRFLTGAGPCAAFDGMWTPAFLIAVFVVHPALAAFACAGMALLAWLAVAAGAREGAVRKPLRLVRRERYVLVRNLQACRLSDDGKRWPETFRRWSRLSRFYSALTFSAYVRTLPAVGLGKGVRGALQSAGVGLGALLAIEEMISPGALFASSLMLGRTLASLDGALAHWQGLVAARESYLRLLKAIAEPGPARSETPRCCGSPPEAHQTRRPRAS